MPSCNIFFLIVSLILFHVALPSLTIPTARHFWKRQYWQRFLLLLSTGQSLLVRHTYFAFFCTVRCQRGGENTDIFASEYTIVYRKHTKKDY